MAFVKERISEADKDLFNSFEAYDYDNERILTWGLAGGPRSKWVVDREREIYFFYVSGGHHLEQHPYQQYDLVWKGKKVVIFLQARSNYDTKPDGSQYSYHSYDIVDIRAPMELKKHERELIKLIIEAIKANHATVINNYGIRKNTRSMQIKVVLTPRYFDEVR